MNVDKAFEGEIFLEGDIDLEDPSVGLDDLKRLKGSCFNKTSGSTVNAPMSKNMTTYLLVIIMSIIIVKNFLFLGNLKVNYLDHKRIKYPSLSESLLSISQSQIF